MHPVQPSLQMRDKCLTLPTLGNFIGVILLSINEGQVFDTTNVGTFSSEWFSSLQMRDKCLTLPTLEHFSSEWFFSLQMRDKCLTLPTLGHFSSEWFSCWQIAKI